MCRIENNVGSCLKICIGAGVSRTGKSASFRSCVRASEAVLARESQPEPLLLRDPKT
jgi:hypothetical protein